MPQQGMAVWARDSNYTLSMLNNNKNNGTYDFYVEVTTAGNHKAYK